MSLRARCFPVALLVLGCRPEPAPEKVEEPEDWDLDGFDVTEDCDDKDREIHPDAVERCDDYDNDCDGEVDEDDAADVSSWFVDGDGDGYGSTDTVSACSQPGGSTTDSTDCDDTDAAVSPAADEVCGDGVDNNCDSLMARCPAWGAFDASDASAWRYGEQAGDRVGTAMAHAGDVDGDGHGDLLLGAHGSNAADVDAGMAWLVRGPITGEATLDSAHLRIEGEFLSDSAGRSVVGLGDQDGDGLDDFAVGADLTINSAGATAGAVGVFLAPLSGTVDLGAADLRFGGEATSDRAGYLVALAGDHNDDGVEDVLIGAPGVDTRFVDDGTVYLLHGPLTAERNLAYADARITGSAVNDEVGMDGACAGDVDGDGVDDLFLAGQDDAWLIPGPVTTQTLTEDAGATFSAWAIAAAGDTDGDGYADLIVGTEDGYGSYEGAGAGLLYRGSADGVDPLHADAWLGGSIPNERVGQAVAGAGDLDGDGYADVALGAELSDVGADDGGAVYLFLGPLSGGHEVTEADAQITSTTEDSRLGGRIASGDLDGDGLSDVLIGAVGVAGGGLTSGGVAVFAGADF